MEFLSNYFANRTKSPTPNLAYLADVSGLFASCLCFIHCWTFPLLLIFIPDLLMYNEMVHPILCSMAMLSTVPILFKIKMRIQSVLFQFALVLGNIIMLTILFAHDHLHFWDELILNTIGGLSLAYVHYYNLRPKGKLVKKTNF